MAQSTQPDAAVAAAAATTNAAKYIGAGIACLGMAGAGIGLGNLFGQFLSGALRNPSAADGQRGTLLLGFALTEALGIFSLLIALLLLFVV
ncbi:MAG: F0F1 ATP synthase subunit C [Pseudomonadota bacterium]